MNYLKKALDLLDDGMMTHDEYVQAIMEPRNKLDDIGRRKDSEAIDAIGYYIDAHDGLLAGEMNMACVITLDDMAFIEDLPASLELDKLRDMRRIFIKDSELPDAIMKVRAEHGFH